LASTSGTATFNYNRNQIILRSLRIVGAFASGETPDAQSVTDASDALNAMVKAWNGSGLHIWTEEEAILFLQANQPTYIIGGTTTDHCAFGTSYNVPTVGQGYNNTTLLTSANNGATTITVASITNITNGDKIGITMDNGVVFWTTVNGVPGGTVPLANALTDTAAAGMNVFNYTTDIIRPLRVVSGRRFAYVNSLDTPMIALSRIDYRNMPNKLATGTITQFFYDPRGGANTQGVINLWPTPSDSLSAFKFTWYRPLQDITTQSQIPDLPTEWLNAIIWNLAAEISLEYDTPPQRLQMIESRASRYLDLASGWDREIESYKFGFDADMTSYY
jgi:hypothetical protein